MIPPSVRRAVEREIGPVVEARPVGGGCINEALRVTTARGACFVKHNAAAPPEMFAAEADGLRALRDAAPEEIRVPEVLAMGGEGTADDPVWIALEWLEPGARRRDFGERLGRGLAALHRARSGGWGWERTNFIGSLPQENGGAATWAEFWRDRRIAPQLRRAREGGRLPGKEAEWERLIARLPDLLAAAEDDGPSLLHGDLWGGNVASASGDPALIDPAVYRGHREADLAMAELFGGFDAAFHAAYREAWPLRPGYDEARRAIYQLYYLLVHVSLFGGGYVAQTAGVLRTIT
ncbi:MAG TPA: fructosamine kinase family protein [Longimicrobium sp.]|nr:fructosamine kinase family protein [Longimicrobium sp.]